MLCKSPYEVHAAMRRRLVVGARSRPRTQRREKEIEGIACQLAKLRCSTMIRDLVSLNQTMVALTFSSTSRPCARAMRSPGTRPSASKLASTLSPGRVKRSAWIWSDGWDDPPGAADGGVADQAAARPNRSALF